MLAVIAKIENLGFLANVAHIDNGDEDCPKDDLSISAKRKVSAKMTSEGLKEGVQDSFGSGFNNILLKVFVKEKDDFIYEVEVTAIVSIVPESIEQKDFFKALALAGEYLVGSARGKAS